MKAMCKRLDALERTGKPTLRPALKKWLGIELTADEQARLVRGENMEPDLDAIDTSGWSQETKQWLGVN